METVDTIGGWPLSEGVHYRTELAMVELGDPKQRLPGEPNGNSWQWSWTVGTFRSGQQGPFLQDLSAKIAILGGGSGRRAGPEE